MVEVLPFPLVRRRAYVRRQAAWFCEQTAKGAENNLFRQMNVQRDALLNRGVDPERVEAEVRALEAAIRCEVWRLVLTPELGA